MNGVKKAALKGAVKTVKFLVSGIVTLAGVVEVLVKMKGGNE